MKYGALLLASVGVVAIAKLASPMVVELWQYRVFIRKSDTQADLIKQLRNHPPERWSKHAWHNTVTTPNNVWINTVYHGRVTLEEMDDLTAQLQAIVNGASSKNSIESIDRIYMTLLKTELNNDFVSRYRQEFHEIAAKAEEHIAAGGHY